MYAAALTMALLLAGCAKHPDCSVGLRGDDAESRYAVQCTITVKRW